ncbi:MAG TPA: DUF167 domain-containing protein [candidate division Zixibacteria bacterium]|nr:DUF167 domain-containing protein [candidate division Zixibacteria bacterium]
MSIRIRVIVKPAAKKEGVIELAPGEYRVSVNAPPAEGRANQAVLELLADYFSVRKSAVRIVAGRSARKKIVEIG